MPLSFSSPARFRAGLCLALSLLPPAALSCRGEITLPPLIGDNMVLQQQAPINVWGHAAAGETVTVEIGEQSVSDTAGPDGAWAVKLEGIHAGGPYDLTISGQNKITLHNVAVGEVWLCAGGSNMAMQLPATRNAEKEIAEANYPMVRMFVAKPGAKAGEDVQGQWLACDPAAAAHFPAAAYFFGRELNEALRTPVGLIVAAQEASPIEAWMPRGLLEKNFPAVLEGDQPTRAGFAAAEKTYEEKLAAWKAALAQQGASTPGAPLPHAPIPPRDPDGPLAPGKLDESLVAPLKHCPLAGVIWYQGEANTGEAALYGKLLPALAGSWREAWGEIPFLSVQLAGFMAPRATPGASRWAEFREAQAKALATLARTGMAVAIDTGAGILPPDKRDVGHRLALLAEALAYDKHGAETSGPVFAGMKVQGRKATLSFQHAGEGLAARSDGPVKGFAIAGEDRKFVWAEAALKGDKVIVQSAAVPNPVAVRYDWADSPTGNLANKAGLPVAPFRTDSWDDEGTAGVASARP